MREDGQGQQSLCHAVHGKFLGGRSSHLNDVVARITNGHPLHKAFSWKNPRQESRRFKGLALDGVSCGGEASLGGR